MTYRVGFTKSMKKGIYLVLLTTTISGFSVFANKIFVSQTEPLVFTTVRNVMVAGFLTGALLFTGKSTSLRLLRSLKKDEWIKLLFIGIFGGGVAFALFFTGLSQIGAVQGNLIHKSLFLWVGFMAIPFLHERPTVKQIVGYGLIFWATYFVAGQQQFILNKGALMVLGATILWALENIVAKVTLKTVPSQIVGWARITIGVPVLFGISLLYGKGQLFLNPNAYTLIPILISAIILTGYVLTWYAGLKRLPATVATSILVLAPVITAVLSGIFLTHTPIPISQSWSFVLLTLGIVLIIVRSRRTTKSEVV